VFEPHCAPIEERWGVIEQLRAAGIAVTATLAPLLPCDPEALIERALDSTSQAIVADPLHVRAVKPSGATTRTPGLAICGRRGWNEWLEPAFQAEVLERMARRAARAGRPFGHGASGFGLLVGSNCYFRGNILSLGGVL